MTWILSVLYLVFVKEGGKVTVADINEDEGLKTVLDFKSRYGKERIHFVTLDVTDAKQFKAAFDATEAFFKAKVHGLVNNAGINHTQGWRKCMDIDIVRTEINGNLKERENEI